MRTSDIDRMVFEWVLNAVWQIGLLSLVALLVQALLRNASAHFRHLYWVVASALCIAIPVLSLFVLGLPSPVEGRTLVIRAFADLPSTVLAPLIEPPPVVVPKTISNYVIWAYLACLGLALFGFVRAIWTVMAFGKRADAAHSDPRLDEVVLHCASAFGVAKGRAVVSDKVRSPMTIGFRKPLILVPSDLVQKADRPTLVAAVGHEMAHIKRKDFLVNLLAQLVAIPVWFHPLIWCVVGKVRRQCELACDELVTASLLSKRVYAGRLLEVAAESIKGGRMRPQLAFGTDALEERVRTLLAPPKFLPSRRMQRVAVVSACSILLIAGAGTSLVFVRAHDESAASAQEQGSLNSDDRIYEVSDKGVVMPKVLTQTIPSYTEEAISERIQGVVVLDCIVRTDGRVTDCRIVRSLGSGLEEASIREIEDNWRFSPATVEGKPVNLRAKIEVTFNLRLHEGEISPSEAEGLAVEGVELAGLTQEQATTARAILKMQDATRFQRAVFQSDVKKLKEEFGAVSGSVYKGNSGGVVVKYRFRAGR